jgi:hypothetical protein
MFDEIVALMDKGLTAVSVLGIEDRQRLARGPS